MTRKDVRVHRELARLEQLAPAELRQLWQEREGGQAPSAPTGLLRRLLAQRVQERAFGGLPLMVARELERIACSADSVAPEKNLSRITLTPGTRLIREWNGQTIAVEVTDSGFTWDDRTYSSLSEIAREVTGAHWSGPRFFGLRRNG